MSNRSKIKIAGLIAVIAAFTTACSGIGGDAVGTPVSVSGPITMGSIIVGGVRFDDSNVSVSADESIQTGAYLEDGMTVRLLGTVNSDGVTGVATAVEVENELRGPITAVDAAAGTFDIFGFTVVIGGDTVFDSGDSLGSLAVNDIVEVYGFQLADGTIRATRVDEVSGSSFEVRGYLTDVTSATFQVGGSPVDFSYDGSTIIDGASSITVGDLIEAEVDNLLYASRIELEEIEDSEYYDGGAAEVEGAISGYVDPDTDFFVGSTRVSLSASVSVFGGDLVDLRNGVVVEVEGDYSGTTLIVSEVEFEDNVAIVAAADGNGAADMFGITINASALTEFDNLADSAAIVAGDPLAIEGYMLGNGSVEAVSIARLSEAVGPDELVLQGPVTGIVNATTIRVLGVTVDLAAASGFSVDDGPALTIGEFVELLQVGSVVEIEGSYAAGIFSAVEAEID